MTVATKTIASGRNTEYPCHYAQDRRLNLIITDGTTRGALWDGMAASVVELGIDPVLAPPTLATSSSGSYSYYCAYRWTDSSGNFTTYSDLSPLTTITGSATTGITYTWTNIQQSLQTRVDGIEFFRSTAGQSTVVYQLYGTGFTASISATANNGGYAQWSATAHGYKVGDWVTTGITGYTGEYIVTAVEDADTFTTTAPYIGTGSGTATQRVYTFGHNGTITSSASDGGGTPKVVFTMPTNHRLGVGAKFLVAGHVDGGAAPLYITTHTVTAVTKTTVTTDQGYTAVGTGGTWTLNGLGSDSSADTIFTAATFAADHKLPILTADGQLNARRHTPPPEHMSVCVPFQDRGWYMSAMEYSLGTVTTATTDQTVTASTAAFVADFVGRYFSIDSESSLAKITKYTSTTVMSMERNGAVSSGSHVYSVQPATTEFLKIYWSEVDLFESVPAVNSVIIQLATGKHDRIVGGSPLGGNLYVLMKHHVYKLTFAAQGTIKVNPTLVATRGCINHRCHEQYEGSLYLLDQFGVWMLGSGGGFDPLSPPIQDMFREGDLDWSKSRWWHCRVDPEQEVIRWFVNFSDANYTKPNRAICYHLRSKDWWTETFVHEIAGACVVEMSGRMRTLYGGMNEQIFLTNQGTSDGTTSPATYTATGGTTTTATGSSLGSTINASIAFITGANKGLARRITTNNGSTIAFLPALPTAVANLDVFTIGGIPWSVKTGLLEYPEVDQAIDRALRITHTPTTNAAWLDARVYRDHNTAVSTNAIAQKPGNGITTTPSSADAVADMKATRVASTAGARDSGFKLFSIGQGRLDPQTQNDRWIAWELRGIQWGDLIEILEMEVHGVQ